MVTLRKPEGGPVRATVRINDEALRRVRDRLKAVAKTVHQHRVTVGIHEQEGATPQPDYHGTTHDVTVAEVATIHEFGAGRVPCRSFLRDWFDEQRQELGQEMVTAMRREYSEEYSGQERSPAMIDFATGTVDSMKQRIEQTIPPELAEATQKARARAGLETEPPLIATGTLLKAIRAHVDGFEVKS